MPKPFLAEICPVLPCCNLSPLPSVLSAVAFYTSEDHYHVSPQSSHFHMMKSLVLSLLPRLRELYLLSSVLSLFDSFHSWKWCFRLKKVLDLNKVFLLIFFQDDICFSCNLVALLTRVQSVTHCNLWSHLWSCCLVIPISVCSVDYSLVLCFRFVLSEMHSICSMTTCILFW